MKKYLIRTVSLLLLLALLTGLTLPFALADQEGEAEAAEETTATETYQVPDITIEAKAALLVDMETDQTLYEQDADTQCYPASITKIMTALLTLEAVGREEVSLNQEVTIPEEAFSDMDEESSTAGLKAGEVLTVENLLYCLMVASANEAANALAITVCGDVPTFVERMNQRAKELGMTGTHFVNPSGLHDPDHYSTARDIYIMAKEGMTHAAFREIVSTKQYTVPATNSSEERTLSNTNGLLTGYKHPGYSIKGTIGIKTGSTGPAGYCLCAAVKRSGHTLISVVLGAENPEIPHDKDDVTRMQFVESARLQEWGFENFTYATLLDADTVKEEVEVRSSFQDNHVILRPAESVTALIPGPYDETLTECKLELDQDPISKSVSAGDTLGTMTVSYGGEVYGVVDMIAVNDVSYSPFLAFVKNVNAVLSNLFVRILLLAALVFAIVGAVRHLLIIKQEAIAAMREKSRAARQVRQEHRAQARQERQELTAQRQVEYEARKKEERLIKAQRAEERAIERARQQEANRLRRQEEQARREEEQARREEERRYRQEEQARRREEERRRRQEEQARRQEEERRYRQEEQARRREEERRRRQEERTRREEARRRREAEEERRYQADLARNRQEHSRRSNGGYGYNDTHSYEYGRGRPQRESRTGDYARRDSRDTGRGRRPGESNWEEFQRLYRNESSDRRGYSADRSHSNDRRGNPPPRRR